MQDEPLIFTTKGNLPISSLRYVHKREDTPGNVVLVEEYFLGDESVKRSVHVCPLVGVCLEGVGGSLT
jgi:hypothetical protein